MSLRSQFIEFGEYLPDLGRINNPGMIKAVNVLPTLKGYRSVRGLEVVGNAGALMGRAIATHWIRHGIAYAFAGDSTRLYLKNAENWDDKSQGGNEYSPATTRWEFVSFGPHVIAVAENIRPQRYNVSTAMPNTAFEDLPNSPDYATTIGVVRDFVVMGNIGGRGDNYIQWSGLNNIETWSPSRITQSDFQPLQGDGGKVQKIIGGAVGYIFRQNSVFLMDYIGPPRIFRIDEFAVGRGTPAPKSVIRLDNFIYYYDNAGFYSLDIRNNQFTPIGQNKVDSLIRETIPESCIEDMQASIDPVNKLIIWSMCADSSTEHNSMSLVYHYELRKWAQWEFSHELMSLVPSVGYHLDNIGTVVGGDDIDTHSINVDSEQYIGGDFVLSAFDTDHKLGTLTGDWLAAELETSEAWGSSGDRIRTSRQIPMVEGYDTTRVEMRLNRRDSLNDNPILTPPSVGNDRGYTYAKANARFVTFNLQIHNGFRHVSGADIYQRGTR